MTNSIRNYFQKVGKLTASTDSNAQSEFPFDLGTPGGMFSFQEAIGAPSLSNYFKVSMELAPQTPSTTSDFPADIGTLDGIRQAYTDENLRASKNLNEWLTNSGVFDGPYKQSRYELLASEATLPGTNMQVVQEVGSRQGIRERFATQRAFTDIAISFYVTKDYASLRLFQEWMNYMNPLYVGEAGVTYPRSERGAYPSAGNKNAFFRFRYPHSYKRDIQITKFERDVNLGKTRRLYRDQEIEVRTGLPDIVRNVDSFEDYFPSVISYNFVNAFPISIQDIQLSYGGGQAIKVTVDFAYDRYFIVNATKDNRDAQEPLGITPEPLKGS